MHNTVETQRKAEKDNAAATHSEGCEWVGGALSQSPHPAPLSDEQLLLAGVAGVVQDGATDVPNVVLALVGTATHDRSALGQPQRSTSATDSTRDRATPRVSKKSEAVRCLECRTIGANGD